MVEPVPPKICLLVTVWGDAYVEDFLTISLPSLIAPGNIPALCQIYNTKLIILTTFHKISVIQKHNNFQKLQQVCCVEFIEIDDLTLIFNTSIIITKSYERGIKSYGKEALNTYFIFLVADYIMANGSMQGLQRYIERGYNGIYAANFQIIKEKTLPFFKDLINQNNNILNISPRDLLTFSFQNVHPVVKSSIYPQTLLENPYVNRFYFKGKNLLVMRGYLLHMLCIKPEILEFTIESTCDYSFIPTLCPSGNTTVITDSDDYLVVEIQNMKHETLSMHLAKQSSAQIAKYLAHWTTEEHRKNALTSVYFHTTTINTENKNHIDKIAASFINKINRHLKNYPPKLLSDIYWKNIDKTIQNLQCISHEVKTNTYFDIRSLSYKTKWQNLFQHWSGQSPNFNFWHPRWYEHYRLRDSLKQYFKSLTSEKMLILYDNYNAYFMGFYTWLKETFGVRHQYHLEVFTSEKFYPLNCEKCLIFASPQKISRLQATITKILTLSNTIDRIDLIIFNGFDQPLNFNQDFKIETFHKINELLGLNYYIDNMYILKNYLPFISTSVKYQIIKHTRLKRTTKLALLMFSMTIGSLLSIVTNIFQYLLRLNKGFDTHLMISIKSYPTSE